RLHLPGRLLLRALMALLLVHGVTPAGVLLELLAKRFDRREALGLLRMEPERLEVLQLVFGGLDTLRQRLAGTLRRSVLLEVLLRDVLGILPGVERNPLLPHLRLGDQLRVARLDLPQVGVNRLAPATEPVDIVRALELLP